MKEIYIFFILFCMAVDDILDGEVSNWWYLFFLPFFEFKIIIIILFSIVLIIYPIIQRQVGGADIKIVFCLLSCYKYIFVVKWLMFSSFIALAYCIYRKVYLVKMFPFFMLGYLVNILWQ